MLNHSRLLDVESTYALIPTRARHHKTNVIEENNIYYLNQSPFAIIKFTCLVNGSDYHARRKAIKHPLNFKRKTPIAINQSLYIFPTHAIKDFTSTWLFSKQIITIKQNTPNLKSH